MRKKTILAIDDDANIRYTLTKIGESAGWKLVTAPNGEEGIRLAHAVKPDVVLVDYHMPGMNGLEVVMRLRQQIPSLIIVVLTVDEREELARQLLDSGANDFALKPIKAPDLISRINVHLQQQPESGHQDIVSLPEKGFTPETMEVIIDYMYQRGDYVSIREVAESVKLAYQTAHRYLNYLKDINKVDIAYKYGQQGRPQINYRIKGQKK